MQKQKVTELENMGFDLKEWNRRYLILLNFVKELTKGRMGFGAHFERAKNILKQLGENPHENN